MSPLKELIAQVHAAIDQGATTVEEVHKTIAAQPFELLKKFTPLEGVSEEAKNIQNLTIGGVYNTIRAVNKEVARVATEILDKRGAKS